MNTDTQTVLRDLARGKHQGQYLIYSRKSTDEAESQKNSISYQGKENSAFAAKEGLAVADVTIPGFCTSGVVAEKHSGFKETDALEIKADGTVQFKIDRPKFQQLVRHLNQGHFKGVVCLCWDRISRNKGDDTVIRKLMRKGIDVRFVYATYDASSSGELHMDIDGMFAQHHSRVTSEKVRLATRAKRAEGKCTYRAPIGYLNTGTMDHKPFDPDRAPIIKEMFELYATGEWSLHDLARFARKQGLTTPPMRKKRTKEEMLADDGVEISQRPKISHQLGFNRIHTILSNPFYVGQIRDCDGNLVPSTSHKALVDPAIFQRVQKNLLSKRVSTHYTKKLGYPFRGFLRCSQCGRTYSPYQKKGHLYYGARCAKDCPNTKRSCNLNFVLSVVRQKLSTLTFTDEELRHLDAGTDTQMAMLAERQRKAERKNVRKRERVQSELDYLRCNQLSLLRTGVYTPTSLTEERSRLEVALDEIQETEDVTEQSMRELSQELVKVAELLKSLVLLAENGKPREIEQIIKVLCVELLLDQKTAQLSPKTGLTPLFERKNLQCEPAKWFAELYCLRKNIKDIISKASSLI